MSTELGYIRHSGSRDIKLQVTRYYGGPEIGPCIQLSGQMEEGNTGYIQLNKKDILALTKLWKNEIGKL